MMSHRGARGNVTYTGLAIDTLQLMIEYFHMRYGSRSSAYLKLDYKMFHSFIIVRIEYVPVDPAEVKKYGFGIALINQLKNNVKSL